MTEGTERGGQTVEDQAPIGLSVMATQAGAITFVGTTGQAFDDRMEFVRFCLALPFAMVVLFPVFVPFFGLLVGMFSVFLVWLTTDISWLYYNVVGAGVVVLTGWTMSFFGRGSLGLPDAG